MGLCRLWLVSNADIAGIRVKNLLVKNGEVYLKFSCATSICYSGKSDDLESASLGKFNLVDPAFV